MKTPCVSNKWKVLLIPFLLAGCEVTEKGDVTAKNTEFLKVISWNVQTLFDGDETGDEYDEYRSSAGWTDEKYKARLHSLAHGLSQADIIGLMEIENARILEDLVQGPLSKQGYNWTFFGKNPKASLGIGVLSRFPFEQTIIHSITSNGETAPRPIVEVRITAHEKALVFLICHWKSKLGGDEPTETLRKAEARIILRRLRELKQEDPGLPVIVLGDLNENYDEFYRKHGSIISALMPDDPKAAELTGFTPSNSASKAMQMDFLILSQKKPPEPEYFAPEALVLYSPWEQELTEGSYLYRDAWETIDHFLLSDALFDQTGWDFDTCSVIKQEPFINSNGHPYTYNPRTGNGLSDHLPLLLVLKDNDSEKSKRYSP